ncbi:hypothetical protein [Chryseobacterium sp. EO14]|uniref:hypothetical protein n=1 Tax=Chryseobacterium sp. EO14 TaxID=2950551 RepID=UPI00210EF9F5|nr:hypothetical protein [Chryseobacterium sp. EO14]MCQ4139530.1 hypothetical protein [Chryseobacterium sp. EO14]
MKNASIVVFSILNLIMCTQKKSINSSEIKIENTKSTGDKETDKLIINLKKSMVDFMTVSKPLYSQNDIDECISILSEYTTKILKTHSREEAMLIVKSTVLKLNTLNEKCNFSLIETNEREQITEIIILASHKMKYNSLNEDITEEWREW